MKHKVAAKRAGWLSEKSRLLVLIGFLGFGWSGQALGQRLSRDEVRRVTASRAELEELAASAEQMAASPAVGERVRRQKAAEAQAIRTRLTAGDFGASDRISITILGAGEPYRDTLTVASGGIITLPNIGPISLRGVLRSELQSHLVSEVGRFLRSVSVVAGPVTRVAIMGAVGRPGFYQMSSDAMLSTAIMSAGGPNLESDLRQIVIRRGDEEVWDKKSVQVALQEGVTLQELGIRSGDEIFVGRNSSRLGPQVMQYVSFLLQIASTVLILSR